VTLSTALVERTSNFLGSRLSRRSLINRAAFAGSAVAIGAGVDLALKPGTAYGAICSCGNPGCGCGSTCCSGFTDFCCSVNGGYNYCPTNTVMGGWWKADNSSFCGGPRYYMDCNATCQCTTGCGNGFHFCDTECDGTDCGCGPNGCSSYMTGCLQFRYGQCNQDVNCMGRIVCRVVACVPPWEVDPTCTTAVAVDNGTAEQTVACWTTAVPSPPCGSPATNCQVIGIASSVDGKGYALLTSFGKVFTYGDFTASGDESATVLNQPIVGISAHPGGGYYFVAADGGVFSFGDAQFYGSMGGKTLNKPIVGMAATPTGKGYWFVAADGGIFTFGDAVFYGSAA
jgi:ribosomal protein L24E